MLVDFLSTFLYLTSLHQPPLQPRQQTRHTQEFDVAGLILQLLSPSSSSSRFASGPPWNREKLSLDECDMPKHGPRLVSCCTQLTSLRSRQMPEVPAREDDPSEETAQPCRFFLSESLACICVRPDRNTKMIFWKMSQPYTPAPARCTNNRQQHSQPSASTKGLRRQTEWHNIGQVFAGPQNSKFDKVMIFGRGRIFITQLDFVSRDESKHLVKAIHTALPTDKRGCTEYQHRIPDGCV